MKTEYKTLLIENENEFRINLLKEIENINELTELNEYIIKLISIQYYKGIFNDSDEYDELLSNKINLIIENEFKMKYDEIIDNYENKPDYINLYGYDESEYKLYIKSFLESYDLFISGIKFKTEITESMKIKTDYLIDEYSENYELFKPEYLDNIIIYENQDEFIESDINELLSCYISDMKFNFKTKSYESFILNYFNYDEYISDMIASDEIIKYEYKYKPDAYIKDMNKYPYA